MVTHLLTLKDWSSKKINKVIDTSINIKISPSRYCNFLSQKSLAMIFQKTSTRTRVSFEVAMTHLGGHSIYLDWRTTNFILGDIRDETEYLSRNVNVIMARLFKNADLHRMVEASKVPIINGCDERYHPCQAISDLMTIKEKKGSLQNVKLVYVGIHNNVCNSLIEGCTKTGVKITTVTPIINEPSFDEELITIAKKTGLYESTLEIKEAVEDADFIYTDTWVDMEYFLDPKFKEDKEKRIKLMKPFQINSKLLKDLNIFVMHDMPIHRGYEISDEVINDDRSIIYEQSENRLHSAKGILLELLSKNSECNRL